MKGGRVLFILLLLLTCGIPPAFAEPEGGVRILLPIEEVPQERWTMKLGGLETGFVEWMDTSCLLIHGRSLISAQVPIRVFAPVTVLILFALMTALGIAFAKARG